MNKFYHTYHLVSVSPWPLLNSLSLLIMLLGVIKMFMSMDYLILFLGYMLFLLVIMQWWRDVIRESTFQGFHTVKVMKGLQMGMILFILSEVMFFVSFFWSYFHMYLAPSVEIGMLWLNEMILIFNPYNVPLLNTLILLSSGVSITWCHFNILSNNYKGSNLSILLTIILGGMFMYFQNLEYNEAYFTISDSVYGSIFFMITGFHGFHVFVGTMFILIIFFRLFNKHFSLMHHFGFEAASWYWHFVDIVWLFLYILIYWMSY